MKGLLLKDWLMLKKYCRIYFFLLVVFAAAAMGVENNLFFLFYPMLLGGTLVVTLISYDERSHWNVYCNTLPCSRRMQVNEKYLFSLLLVLGTFVCLALLQLIRGLFLETPDGIVDMGLLLILLAVGILPVAVLLPVVFRLGVEKGRIGYYIVVAGGVAAGTVVMNLIENEGMVLPRIFSGRLAPVLVLLGLALLLLVSWQLSLRFYQNREL